MQNTYQYESLYPETKHGGDRKTNVIAKKDSSSRQFVDLKNPSFTEQTSKKLNVATRTLNCIVLKKGAQNESKSKNKKRTQIQSD